MALETKKVLITVKTYPNPSTKYGETVCCAGIDLRTNEWIRLYPITYRDLDNSKKFKKYTIIEVKCEKAKNDKRLESYRVDVESIKIVKWLDSKKKWESRKEFVIPTISPSFCHILSSIEHNKSLGTFKPCKIDFSWKKSTLQVSSKREKCYAQLSFFDKKKNTIEEIPYIFYYHFKCAENSECSGHKLPILDWEIGQAYRDWRNQYATEDILLAKIKERWLNLMCSKDNDVYFYTGNMQRFKDQFMILGTFYPKKINL
ncbi:MAG: hypothetical protein WC476_05800 [Phycisphaerae bacterium]